MSENTQSAVTSQTSQLANQNPPRLSESEARAYLDRVDRSATPQKPLVSVPGGGVSISDSARIFFEAARQGNDLFIRGGVVVQLRAGAQGIRVQVMNPVAAQSAFEKYAEFCKPAQHGRNFDPKLTTLSESVAKQYLQSEECRNILPQLNGIISCPMLIENQGELHRLTNGYDPVSGLYVDCRWSAAPTELSLEDAVNYLKDLVSEFEFVTPGDRSRALASLITPAMKLGGHIKGACPIDVAEANASQSGKTYRHNLIAAVYNTTPALITKTSGGVGSLDEAIGHHLIEGRPFIMLDNVRGRLDNQTLEATVTAQGMVTFRLPYQGQLEVDSRNHLFYVSSNGFEATKDLVNRASIVRIRKREGHQFKVYPDGDLLSHVRCTQPMAINSVLRVVEEWHRRGCQRTAETRHDFREWCQKMDWIVQELMDEPPLMDGHDQAQTRAADPQLVFLRALLIQLAEQGKLGDALSATDITETCLDRDLLIVGLKPENQDVPQGRKQIGRILNKLFGDQNHVQLEEFEITRENRVMTNESQNRQLMTFYTFQRAGCNPEPVVNSAS